MHDSHMMISSKKVNRVSGRFVSRIFLPLYEFMYLQILFEKIAGPIVKNIYDLRILNVFESNSQRQMPVFNNNFRKNKRNHLQD